MCSILVHDYKKEKKERGRGGVKTKRQEKEIKR